MEAGADSAGASVAASQALAAGVAVDLAANLDVSRHFHMWLAHLSCSHTQARNAWHLGLVVGESSDPVKLPAAPYGVNALFMM